MRIEIYKFLLFISLVVVVIAVWYWATEGFDKFIKRIGRDFKEGWDKACENNINVKEDENND